MGGALGPWKGHRGVRRCRLPRTCLLSEALMCPFPLTDISKQIGQIRSSCGHVGPPPRGPGRRARGRSAADRVPAPHRCLGRGQAAAPGRHPPVPALADRLARAGRPVRETGPAGPEAPSADRSALRSMTDTLREEAGGVSAGGKPRQAGSGHPAAVLRPRRPVPRPGDAGPVGEAEPPSCQVDALRGLLHATPAHLAAVSGVLAPAAVPGVTAPSAPPGRPAR